jgi:hypothetical protein
LNRPFRDHLKDLYSEWLLTGDHALTPAGIIKKPSVTVCQWIIMALQHISPEVIVKGFKKCCTSSAMDVTDDMLWNGSEEDGNVSSECEEEVKVETVHKLVKVDRI